MNRTGAFWLSDRLCRCLSCISAVGRELNLGDCFSDSLALLVILGVSSCLLLWVLQRVKEVLLFLLLLLQ